ncbi:MAG: FAD-dependent oxidoreductase [Flavobacteriales bacterium]
MNVAIAGGGLFGCCIAIELAKSGYRIDLIEEQPDIMMEASRVNHNRIHLGYHYLRSIETAEQSLEGLLSFMFNFGNAVKCQFPNYYAIAKHKSKTSPAEFIAFCNNVGISYDDAYPAPELLDPTQLQACYRVPEPIFDYEALKKIVREYLVRNKVNVHVGTPVTGIVKQKDGAYSVKTASDTKVYDVVINSTYKNFNTINNWLGIEPITLLYEHVVIPRFLYKNETFGLTVMDGEFCSVMPQGMSENEFLLYHVKASVLENTLQKERPVFTKKAGDFVPTIYEQASLFMPFLKTVKQNGYQEITRVVHKNSDDARLTELYTFPEHKNYFAVLSGKITTCYQLAIEIKHYLEGKVTSKRFKI